jgi:hypothetical protein
MANFTVAAGGNGVAGSFDASVARTVSGTYAASNKSVSGTHAIRRSVVKTAAGVGSEVFSETQNLRFAYPVVEADAPIITRT